MIETLILGILLGFVATTAGAAYAFYRYLKEPYVRKKLSDGYEVVAIDRKFDNDNYSYLALRKDEKIVSAIRFNADGDFDAVHDIV